MRPAFNVIESPQYFCYVSVVDLGIILKFLNYSATLKTGLRIHTIFKWIKRSFKNNFFRTLCDND